MVDRMRQLEACMRYDADRLIEIMANDCGTHIEISNLIDDYKAKRAEYIELEVAFRKEYIIK